MLYFFINDLFINNCKIKNYLIYIVSKHTFLKIYAMKIIFFIFPYL